MAQKIPPQTPSPSDCEGWPPESAEGPSGIFQDETVAEGVPTLLDLIPRHGQPLGMLLTGIAAVALLLAGYRGFGADTPAWVSTPLSGFGLEGPGNLASWFSTLVLTAAGIYALIIWWTLHWVYRQKSGVWLAAALWWFYLGMDESAGLHLALGKLGRELAGSPSGSALWWLIPYAFISLAIASRLLLDLRRSWTALLWMGTATACYLISLLVQVGVNLSPLLGVERVVIEELGELAGHWFLLMAHVSFAAYLVRGMVWPEPPDEAAREQQQEEQIAAAHQPASSRRKVQSSRTPTEDHNFQGGGDLLIIHPPHGYGPPRVVKRIVRPRKQTTRTKTSRKRSDLDLPTRTTTTRRTPVSSTEPAALSGQPASVASRSHLDHHTCPQGTDTAPPAMNAFLAGMAYAEAQRSVQATASASSPMAPSPIRQPTRIPSGNLGSYTSHPGHATVGQPTSATVLPEGPSAGRQPGLNAANIASGNPSNNTTSLTGQSNNTLVGPARAAVQPAVSSSASTTAQNQSSTATPQASIQLPARKLTKEEKKRLKQLYKQRIAQQAAQGTGT